MFFLLIVVTGNERTVSFVLAVLFTWPHVEQVADRNFVWCGTLVAVHFVDQVLENSAAHICVPAAWN